MDINAKRLPDHRRHLSSSKVSQGASKTDVETDGGEIGKVMSAIWYQCNLLRSPSLLSGSGLLDALTKNGSSASNGAYRRRAAEGSDHTGARADGEGQESGGGDSAKTFTKEQVDGVQRWLTGTVPTPPTASLLLSCSIRALVCHRDAVCTRTHRRHQGNLLRLVPCPWGEPFKVVCSTLGNHCRL